MISWAKPLNPVLTFVKQFKIKVTENQTSFHDVVSGDEFNYELLDCKPFTYYSFQLFTLTSNDCESLASETVEIQTQGRNVVAVNERYKTRISKYGCQIKCCTSSIQTILFQQYIPFTTRTTVPFLL